MLLIPLLIGLSVNSGDTVGAWVWVSIAGAIIYTPIVMLASGVLYAYVGALWALTFKRLTEDERPVVEAVPAG